MAVGCQSQKTSFSKDSQKQAAPVQNGELSPSILEQCKQKTVLIGNFENGELFSTGSGFIAEDGKTIFSNKHVVTGSDDEVDDCKIVFSPGTPNARIENISKDQIQVYENAKRGEDD